MALWPLWTAAGPFQRAPVNPAFLQAQGLRSSAALTNVPQANAMSVSPGSGYSLGFLPGPALAGGPDVRPCRVSPQFPYPAAYDLRALGKTTPVRDQGHYGTCWAFATYGSMESCLLTNEARDFSENHMANGHGFDVWFGAGGNSAMSTAYLSRWGGPYDESDDPYPNVGFVPPPTASLQKHIQATELLPERQNVYDENGAILLFDEAANDAAKGEIMTHGALFGAFCFDPDAISADNTAYWSGAPELSSRPTSDANHGVTFAGWDDNYDKANFLRPPPGNGAFLVKNSWGASWGDQGYFWISFYESTLTELCSFGNAEPADNYVCAYSYDPLGWCGSIGASNGTDTAWAANVFKAYTPNTLAAVSFYATAPGCEYEVQVFTGVPGGAPTSGTLAATATGTVPFSGYHTVKLDAGVPLVQGKLFSVVLKARTPGYAYPIAIETAVDDYSSKAVADAGQSFASADGSSWTDLTISDPTAKACIKAFCTGTKPYGSRTVSVTIRNSLADDPATVNLYDAAMLLRASITNITADGTYTFRGVKDGMYILLPGGHYAGYPDAARKVTVAGSHADAGLLALRYDGPCVGLGMPFELHTSSAYPTNPLVYIRDNGKPVFATPAGQYGPNTFCYTWNAKVSRTGYYPLYYISPPQDVREGNQQTLARLIADPKWARLHGEQRNPWLLCVREPLIWEADWEVLHGWGFGPSWGGSGASKGAPPASVRLEYKDARGRGQSIACQVLSNDMSASGESTLHWQPDTRAYNQAVARGIRHFTLVLSNLLGSDRSWSIDRGSFSRSTKPTNE
jgi:C1A family cysteine protease